MTFEISDHPSGQMQKKFFQGFSKKSVGATHVQKSHLNSQM